MSYGLITSYRLCIAGLLLIATTGLTAEPAPFQRVSPDTAITLPKDHRLHPGFQTEWWYVTASLQGEDNKQYGAQFTLFSSASLTGGKPQRVFFAHATLSTEQQFYFSERYARDDMGHAGVQPSPWLAYIDHWLYSGNKEAPLPGTITVSEAEFSYQLNLSDSPYYLQGEEGFSRKNSRGDLASHYYSAPFIKVNGTLIVAGKQVKVTGQAWLDREWSSNVIAVEKLGWDWLSLHLDQNRALMLYRIRSNGETLLNGRLMNRDGSQKTIPASAIQWTPLSTQRFGERDYAIQWQLQIPGEGIDLKIQPINNNQYLNTRIPYWEGAVTTTGSHRANGFLELFGERE